MHMCVHATPEGEPSVTLMYLLICSVTSQPLPCSGTNEEKHTRVAEPHISMSCFFRHSFRHTTERCCSQWTMKPSHPPLVLFLFLFLSCTVFKFFLTKSHLLNTYSSEKRDYAIKNTSVNVTRALGKLFDHYHTHSGIYFDPFLQRCKLQTGKMVLFHTSL